MVTIKKLLLPIRILCISVFLLLFSTFQVNAVENGNIGGKPARPREDNPRSQSIFVHELNPGSSVNEAILLVNNSDVEKTILVYPVDSQVASGGTFTCAQKADMAVGVGTWIKLAEERVVLKPNTTKEVPFTITVPKTATPGEQNGCIAIQAEEPPQATQQEGVTLSFRSAIRVAITVPGEITKDLTFIGPVVVKRENDLLRLSAGLKNNGNVSLDTDVQVIVRSLIGTIVRQTGGEYPVLSGNELVLNFETKPPFWGGWYSVEGQATYSADTTKTLGEGGTKKTITGPSRMIYVSPQPLAIVIEVVAVLVIAVSVVWYLRRRKHLQKLHAAAIAYKVKKTDTLQKIATKHELDWKDIAKLNKLKAPYHIEPGSEIKLPIKSENEVAKKTNKKSKETPEKKTKTKE